MLHGACCTPACRYVVGAVGGLLHVAPSRLFVACCWHTGPNVRLCTQYPQEPATNPYPLHHEPSAPDESAPARHLVGPQSRRRCGRGEPQSRCRCGTRGKCAGAPPGRPFSTAREAAASTPACSCSWRRRGRVPRSSGSGSCKWSHCSLSSRLARTVGPCCKWDGL